MKKTAHSLYIATALLAGNAWAAADKEHLTLTFSIEAQRLDTALTEFAQATGLQLLFPSNVAMDQAAPRIQGSLTADAALQLLLKNTGLSYRYINEKTVAVSGPRADIGAAAKTAVGEVSRLAQLNVAVADESSVAGDTSSSSGEAVARSPSASEPVRIEEIVVTGSRIRRDSGYDQPTPVTVVGMDEIHAKAPQNVSDLVNELPSVAGSLTPRNSAGSPTFSLTGLNAINMRGLDSLGAASSGANFTRTLVLLDGHRTVPSNVNGMVDVNNFPQQLIKRIEIVTGGASAAYGSDAVAGVVNFVLDHDFTGLKADVQGGVTTHGDGRSRRAAVSGGFKFAADRGHVLLSTEIARSDGIYGIPRDWAKQGKFAVPNPAYVPGNGQPQFLVTSQAALNGVTYGGIINTTALRGTAFGPGGTPFQFNYGALGGAFMVGGDWQSNQFFGSTTLDPEERRENAFGRASFKLSDRVEIFGLASYSHAKYPTQVFPEFSFGNITVLAGNPFIPASVAAQMTAQGIPSFTMGSMNGDLPPVRTQQGRSVERYQAGLNGDFEALGDNWTWDVFFEHGIATEADRAQLENRNNFALALDAVRHPTTGEIVCRSTLTNPANGCVAYNPMGIGVNSQAAINYIIGENPFDLTFKQNVAAANLQGEPFSTWAAPVSIAVGLEHRDQKVTSQTNPLAAASAFIGSNYAAISGKLNVKEAYLETVIPLAKDMAWADSLEFNGAVRVTDYSTSGTIETWKVGATYAPIPDIRLRVTRSRDIRAPNIREFFAGGGATGTGAANNPFDNNNPVTFALVFGGGNPNLKPEVADTLGLGVVVEPSFIPGLTASVDYFQIDIDDAIGSAGAQTILDRCFAGDGDFCSAIERTGNTINLVDARSLNFVNQKMRGVDFDLTYRRPLLGGRITLHGLASHYLEKSTTDTAGEIDYLGVSPREWSFRATAAYDRGPTTFNLTGRGFVSGDIATNYVACTSSCPLSTGLHPTISTNRAPGAFYLDAAVAYRLNSGKGADETELFLSVSNVLDRDPAIYGAGGIGSPLAAMLNPANASIYDVLGRVFRVGARFKF